MRCLALAEAWQDAGGTASFLSAELPDALQSRIRAHGMGFARIDAIPGSLEDAILSAGQGQRLNAGWMVVDGDRFRGEFLKHIQSTGIRVLLIDDFADRESFPADLIVNADVGVDAKPYRRRGSDAQVLAGPGYVLLRREFRVPRQRRPGVKGNRFLVTLGGSDPDELTPRIATALAGCAELQLTVVAGAAYSDAAALQRLSAPNIRVVVDSQNIADLMSESDMAVIAAGGTLWELLSMGCAVLSYARNTVQKSVVESLAKDGVVVDLGETVHFDPSRLVFEVRRLAASPALRQQMATRGRALVDGLGAGRVVEAMLQLTVGMVPVIESDREEFLRMAVRHFSELNPAFVPKTDWTQRYFPSILSNPNYFLRWIMFEGERAGFILFGIEDHRFLPRKTGAIHELYVLPELRRRGMAKACAIQAIRELWTHSPSKIQLEVVEGRTAAVALWESLGFHKVTERFVLDRSAP